jgi:diaminopimelate epimerase
VIDRNTIIVRTYERGVEDETLSCGTGVTASCLICGKLGLTNSPTKAIVRLPAELLVSYDPSFSNIKLSGAVEVSFPEC